MSKTKNLNRRDFLNKISRTVGGTAVMTIVSPVVKDEPAQIRVEETNLTSSTQKGYRLTKHVETYYQLADF